LELTPLSHSPAILFDLPIHRAESFYDQEKTRLFRKASNVDVASFNITKFVTTAAHRSMHIRAGLLNAGALSCVLIAFANTDFQLLSLMDGLKEKGKKKEAQARHRESPESAIPATPPISLEAIEAEASTLTVLMHTTTFRRAWADESFNMRRHLCSLLVDSLLEEHIVAGRYVWTRALFGKILE
jgi:hypothetical protein